MMEIKQGELKEGTKRKWMQEGEDWTSDLKLPTKYS